MILLLVGAAVSMAVRDALGTCLVVAEARGRRSLAATLDAVGDLASIAVYTFGAGEIAVHGLTVKSVAVVAVMVVTSWLGTWYWTGFARRF